MNLPTPELDGRVSTAVFASAVVLTVLVLATTGGAAGAVPVGSDENATSCEEIRLHVPTVVETGDSGTEQVMVLTAHCFGIDGQTGPVDDTDATGQSAESVAVQRSHQSTTVDGTDERDVTVVQHQSQCTNGAAHRVQQQEQRVVRADGGERERYEIHQEVTQTGTTCRAEQGQSSPDAADDSVSTSSADDVDVEDTDVTVDVTVDGATVDVVENESAVADDADAVADSDNE